MSPDYRQTFLCFFVYLYLLFFPSLSFFPKAPFPTLLLLLIAFMFSSLCLLLTFPPLLPLPQRSYISRSSLLFAPPALPRRICLPPPLLLPASCVPPARSWLCFDSRPVHNQTSRRQLVFFVRLRAPLGSPHAPLRSGSSTSGGTSLVCGSLGEQRSLHMLPALIFLFNLSATSINVATC